MKISLKTGKIFLFTFFVLTIFLISGCQTTYDLLRADPAPQTKFLPSKPELSEMESTFPFRKMWIDKTADWKDYTKIIILPVSTKNLFDISWWGKFNEVKTVNNQADESQYFARFIQLSFRNALKNDPSHRFKEVSSAGEDTVILELAIVKVVPSKSSLTIIETVAGFFIPGVGLLTIFNSGEIAIEGKVTDAQTGRPLMLFADREKDRAAIINLAGLQWYKSSENNVDCWSEKFIEIMNTSDYEDIWIRCPVTLIDW